MNFINYDGELNFDNFEEFVNELKACNQEEDITFFLTTNGGEYAVSKMIYSALMQYPKRIYVDINFECSSGGFLLLADMIKSDSFLVHIGDSAFAIVHKASVDYSIDEVRRNTSKAKFWEKRLNFINDNSMKVFKELNFTEDELKIIKSGEDLYLDSEDLRRVLKCC